MTCIELCINDDGSLTVSAEEMETPEMEAQEDGNAVKQPVKTIEEALQAIRQLYDAAAMPEGEMGQDPAAKGAGAMAPGPEAQMQEEEAMQSGFRGM